MLVCVWKSCIKSEHSVAIVHGDDITIGGERSVVKFLIKMISRKYEIQKQKIAEDPALEKSGKILHRVIRANHSATPCAVERKEEDGARRIESKGENRCGQGQTQIKHERDDVNEGDDRD